MKVVGHNGPSNISILPCPEHPLIEGHCQARIYCFLVVASPPLAAEGAMVARNKPFIWFAHTKLAPISGCGVSALGGLLGQEGVHTGGETGEGKGA